MTNTIENMRKDAEQQAEARLDKDAIAAIEETQNAIRAIAGNRKDDAVRALEQATGKINILVARNPENTLIPVSHDVAIIDLAPQDIDEIVRLADAADAAMFVDDYPTARTLLYRLMSEIRVRTYNLPLASYPTALTEAARLLDQDMTREAGIVLVTALNTLVAIDKVTPIPLILARQAIEEAEAQRDKDREAALRLLNFARNQLNRARELAYAGKDPGYKELNDELSNIEKQLKGKDDTSSLFSKLRQKMSAFLKRQSERERADRGESQREQAERDKAAQREEQTQRAA